MLDSSNKIMRRPEITTSFIPRNISYAVCCLPFGHGSSQKFDPIFFSQLFLFWILKVMMHQYTKLVVHLSRFHYLRNKKAMFTLEAVVDTRRLHSSAVSFIDKTMLNIYSHPKNL